MGKGVVLKRPNWRMDNFCERAWAESYPQSSWFVYLWLSSLQEHRSKPKSMWQGEGQVITLKAPDGLPNRLDVRHPQVYCMSISSLAEMLTRLLHNGAATEIIKNVVCLSKARRLAFTESGWACVHDNSLVVDVDVGLCYHHGPRLPGKQSCGVGSTQNERLCTIHFLKRSSMNHHSLYRDELFSLSAHFAIIA